MTNRDTDRYGNDQYGQQYNQEWRNTGNYRYGEGPFGNWGPGYYGYGQDNQGNQGFGYRGGEFNPGGWNQYGTRYGNQGWGQGSNNQEWNQGYGQRQGYGQGWGQGAGNWNQNMNQSQRGPFSGVGPQNYQRSDQRIQEDINDRLTEHPNLDARNINVDVHNGEVTLNGWVNSRQDKRMADDIADSVTGVKNVSNNLSVQPSHQDQPGWMQSVENAFTPGSTPSSTQNQGQQTTGTGTRR